MLLLFVLSKQNVATGDGVVMATEMAELSEEKFLLELR
jgi:hypothetical protein